MSRIALFHWNAEEARERAARLRASGHRVKAYSEEGGEGARALRSNPPDIVVIDLNRLPSHGGHVATFLRQAKTTRHVPIVFVEGDPQKTARVRKLLPDAVYTPWSRVRSAVREALRRKPERPVVPDTMAGYSGTPLPRKLGIRAGYTVALLGAPNGFERTVGTLPERVSFKRQARGQADLAILFAKSRADLERRFPAAKRVMGQVGKLWIAWPKKTSGVKSDLGEADVRAKGLKSGLVDFKICAIDATWSGLLFSRRRRAAT
ncbi:MAG: response regulator [Planctomycetota bacterium]|jgi:CheY-like chemotaxis protein